MKTIFVLDDDSEQAELLAQALSMEGVRVRAFSDPIRALAVIQAENPDLLIADVSMPWIDGGAVMESARLKSPQLAVILVSGFSGGGEVANRHGVPFFAKPVDLNRLRGAVRSLLGMF